jgi:aspartate racemase
MPVTTHAGIRIHYEIEELQHAGQWDEATRQMIAAARHVESGGADFLVICTNTMHKMAEQVRASIQIPLLHIADATAELILAQGLHKIGLLGTRFTMEEDFYKGRLLAHGLEVVIPDVLGREIVHRVIYDELCLGQIHEDSHASYKVVMNDLVHQGAQGIILGCTEIGLLVKEGDASVPLFDTTRIHAEAAVDFALR